MQNFANKVVLVTGAAGNLGCAVAQAFAQAGAALILVDLTVEGLSVTQTKLGQQVDSIVITTDLLRPDSVAAMAEQALARFPHIDILANIAGGFTMGPPVHETSDRDWDFMLNLNARTVFNCCRAIIPTMLKQGDGAIINISARAGLVGQPHMAPYCAAKAAVITLTESLAAENIHHGIRVNCVLPSLIDTPQNRAAMPTANYANWVAPEALADVIMFLASPAARSITGAAIPVYGRS